MNRKRQISASTLCSLVERIEPNRAQAQKVLRQASLSLNSARGKTKLEEYRLSEDQFSMISEGIHYAILSLMCTEDFDQLNLRAIAAKLGYHVVKVTESIERLERLGFISKENNLWKLSYPRLSTSEDIASNALRRAHKEILKMAERSIDIVPMSKREFTSITMAVNPSKIPAAKKLIRKFRDDLAQLLESGKKEEVYELEIGLFPLLGQ